MVVLANKTIREWGQRYPAAAEALRVWATVVEEADWSNMNDMKRTFLSADYIANNRFVFNIKGNHYRLVARVLFPIRTVFLKGFYTHKQYSKLSEDDLANM